MGHALCGKRYTYRTNAGNSDNKLVHNLATGLDVLETSAGLILFAKDGMDALKSIKNFTGKCKILGSGGTNLLDDAAELGVKSADGIPNNSVVDNIIEGDSQAAEVIQPSKPHTNGTEGHWETILDEVDTMKNSGDYSKIYVNKGLSNEIPGARPNRRKECKNLLMEEQE